MAADQIIQVEETAPAVLRAAGLQLQAGLLMAFTPQFEACIEDERAELAKDSARLNAPMNPMPYADEAHKKMVEIVMASPFPGHFGRTLVRDDGTEVSVLQVHHQTLANHFGTAIHVERSWWADQNPDDPESAIFKARFHG